MKLFFLKKVKDSPWARLWLVARIILIVVVVYYLFVIISLSSLDCIKCAESTHSWEALLRSWEQGIKIELTLLLSLLLLLFL